MGAVWMRARAELRARWRAMVASALLLGLFGGAVIATVAGARRTESAHRRFLAASNAFDVLIADFSVFAPVFWTPDFDALEGLPYVVDSARVKYFIGDGDRELFGSADPRWGTEFNRARILEGRRPAAIDEVMVPFASSSLADVRVGQTVTVMTVRRDETPVEHRMKVVGRSAMPGDFPPVDLVGDMLVVHPSFVERYGDEFFTAPGVELKFARGAADMERFTEDIARMAAGKASSPFRLTDQAQTVQRSFDLQAIALWLLAGMLAITGALVVGQTISRQVALESEDFGALHALGMSARGLLAAGLVRVTIVALCAVAAATVVAVAASPLFPLGHPRIAEPNPGVAFDAVAVGLGAVGVLLVGALAPLPALVIRSRARATAAASGRTSALVGIAARAGLPAPLVTGIRHGLEPGAGSTSVPVRSTLAAVAMAVAALVAAFTFGASLDHLLETPRLYGQNWHHVYGFNRSPETLESARTAARDPDIEAVALGASGLRSVLDEVGVEGMTIEPVKGSIITTPLIAGEMPGPGEILVGPRTLEQLGKEVGDEVSFAIEGVEPSPVRIAGVGVLPPIAEDSEFGEGLLILDHSLACIVVGEEPGCRTDDELTATDLIVRFADGLDVPAEIEETRATLTKSAQDQTLFTTKGGDLLNFGRVNDLPVALAGILSVLALGVLAHVLITSIRRRRRDHAVLRTLGFVRAQVRRAVAWQATVVVAIALLVGVPAGIVVGRSLWSLLAGRLGVIVEPKVAWLPVLVVPIAGLALANLLALVPARAASRIQPATVLRAE